MVDAPLTPQGIRIRDVQLDGASFMSVEMALEIWKWRLSVDPTFPAIRLGNDFRPTLGNPDTVISKRPPLSPLTGDRPTLNVGGQPGRRG